MLAPRLATAPLLVPAALPAVLDPGTLTALLDRSLLAHRGSAAFRAHGGTVLYRNVDDQARALAAWLQAQGLAAGERVALMLPNSPQFGVAALAVWRAGLVVLAIPPQSTAAEAEWLLRDSGARAVIASDEAADTLEPLLETSTVRLVVVAGAGDLLGPLRGPWVNRLGRRVRRRPSGSSGAWNGWRRLAEALARGRRMSFTPPVTRPDDIAALQYTGGTTGAPKAAVLLHRQLVANVRQAQAWLQPALGRVPAGEQLAFLAALPMHHSFGFTVCLLLGLHLGACLVLAADSPDGTPVMRALARHRVHVLPAPSSLLAQLLRHPDLPRLDWNRLVLTVAGGMPVNAEVAGRWQDHTGSVVLQGYGLAEASPCVSCTPASDLRHDGSVGLPLPGTEIVVLDDHGSAISNGTVGEVAVRGPQVMAGYWHQPEETTQALTPDGFLRTGDIGRLDAQGRLHLVDRKKDLVIVSGLSVVPAEVEAVVAQLPGVAECAAYGAPDAQLGEVVKLVVVRREAGGPMLGEGEIRSHCEAHLSPHKWPRQIDFRPSLPRSPLGKLLRRELRNGA